MGKKLKVVAVIIGAVVLSTIAINASDVLRGINGSLSGLAIESTFGPCGEHAAMLQLGADDGDVTELFAILDQCDALRFAPGSGDAGTLLSRAKEFLDRMEGKRRV